MTKKMMTLNRSLEYMFIRGLSAPTSDTRFKYKKLPTWASDWQSLWSERSILPVERRLLQGFQVDPHNDNPILAGSNSSVLRVYGTFYGTIESMTCPILLDSPPLLSANTKFFHFFNPSEWIHRQPLRGDDQVSNAITEKFLRMADEIIHSLTMTVEFLDDPELHYLIPFFRM